MRLKITSNGTMMGTRVVNAETGEPVGAVQSIDIHQSVNVAPEAQIVTAMQEYHFEGSFYSSKYVLEDFFHWMQDNGIDEHEKRLTISESDTLLKAYGRIEAFLKARAEARAEWTRG